MREPQVVSRSRVQKMSLCAIGMPVSGPASPFARRASARRASERLRAASTVMKAFSSPLSCAMRSRWSCVSSTEESFLAASAAESSESVAFSKLLYDLGDEVQAVLDRRGDRLIKLLLVGLGDLVGTQPLPAGQMGLERMRHRLDAAGIHGAHLVDQAKHPVQALQRRLGLFRPDGDAGKPRDAADLVVGKRHSDRRVGRQAMRQMAVSTL